MLKKADVWVIIVTTAASALVVDTDADAVVIVAVFITCVTTAGVFCVYPYYRRYRGYNFCCTFQST